MEIISFSLLFLMHKKFSKFDIKFLSLYPLLSLTLLLVITGILSIFTKNGLAPIKPDQVDYVSFGFEMLSHSFGDYKIVLQKFKPEITFHYGMWFISAVIHKFSFFPILSFRLLCLVLNCINLLILKDWFQNKFLDHNIEKIIIIFALIPSFFIFNQLFLKDSLIVFTIFLLLYSLKLLSKKKFGKSVLLFLCILFIQYHLRLVTLIISLIIYLNYAFLTIFNKKRFEIILFSTQCLIIFFAGLNGYYLTELSGKLLIIVKGLENIFMNFTNFIEFLKHLLFETLGFSFFLRPSSEFFFTIKKVIMSRVLLFDSLLVPLLTFIFFVGDIYKKNFRVITLGVLPVSLYFLVYYTNYNIIGNNALYSFRISLPLHVLFTIYLLSKIGKRLENNSLSSINTNFS